MVSSILLFIISRLMIILVLVNNLRVHVKPMFRLYCILKDREDPPSTDEIAVASGMKKLDATMEAEYLKKLENTPGNIRKAFEDQQARARMSRLSSFDHLCLYV
jgi:hypothetical protein